MLKIKELKNILSRLSKREKAVLYIAIFVVGSMFCDRLVIEPVYSRINALNSEIKEKEFGIKKYLRILAQKDRILEEKKKYALFFASGQLEDESITSILKEVENLANKSSLYVVDMKPGGVREEADNTKRFRVSLTCEGEMEQIIDFMYNIENSQVLLTIDRYQISPKSKESLIAQCVMGISKIVIPKE